MCLPNEKGSSQVTNNSQLEEVKDSILGQHSYLTFVDKFRSFGILTVDVPEENEDDALGDIRGVEGVKRLFGIKKILFAILLR